MRRSRAAFTLIEIVLAISIALIVVALGVTAIGNAFGGNKLEETYRDFDTFVRKAQDRALAEHRDFVLRWQKDGIMAEPRIPTAEDGEAEVAMYASNGAKITLERIAALVPTKEQTGEWPIWRSGVCEPTRITYDGDLGTWVAEYDPLTARSRLTSMQEK